MRYVGVHETSTSTVVLLAYRREVEILMFGNWRDHAALHDERKMTGENGVVARRSGAAGVFSAVRRADAPRKDAGVARH